MTSVFQAKKSTLTMPARRLNQCFLWSGDEAAPTPSTQVMPNIVEGHEIEAFAEIEEVEL
jgi:hypothetical protein